MKKIRFGLFVALIFFMQSLYAQDNSYPNKPIKIVVPYPPGGFNDTLGRILAPKLSEIWKQPVLVENRTGGVTTIGTSYVATSPPDGYTMLIAQFPYVTNPFLMKNLPYDTSKAFNSVILAGRSPTVFVTSKDSPYKSLQDVIKAAKANPGKLNYGSSGNGSSNHLSMALFEKMANVEMRQIPYKGSTGIMTDVAGGQVDVAIDVLGNIASFLQTGKVRTLAIGQMTRSPLMPQVPTMNELGITGYDVNSWHAIVVPAGTPRPVIDKINQTINEILKMSDVRETFRIQGVVPDGGTPEQLDAFLLSQSNTWGRLIKTLNITAD
ncbi:MAG: tripartite tricarboxylate transporter substrate binding protein [Betaproteobacteria bacterium]